MRTQDPGMDWEMDPRSDHAMGPGLGRGSYREMEPEPRQQAESRDLTLGMTALLGIFLAVVLVCAVFFGFGYSTGRTLHGSKAASTSGTAAPKQDSAAMAAPDAPAGTTQENAATAPALTAAPPLAKPSAGAPLSDDLAAKQDATEPYPAALRRTAPPLTQQPAFDVAPTVAAKVLPAVATGGVMVQIAAVARPGDADMLARALRSSGYAATVRTEPQDKFLHVQVGPFATRDEAKAMRARLQGDGYNAFLKP